MENKSNKYFVNYVADKKVSFLRTNEDWTQTELANKCDTSQQTISDIERGKRILGIDLAIKLAKAFGVDLDTIYGIKEIDYSMYLYQKR